MKRFFVALMVVVMSCFSISLLAPTSVEAAGDEGCEEYFLTFRPWHAGLEKDEKCRIMAPNVEEDSDALTVFVWTIVLNVLADLFGAVGYLAVGFLIYGGYMYVIARGDPGKVARGKKTIVSAIIGLVIAILATTISSTIVNILTSGG